MADDKKPQDENVHAGHRRRLRGRFRTHGLDSFNDHNALELLLFYAQPRGDTNPLAHTLMKRFGSFAGVFDASLDDLEKTDGVGENTATLIKLVTQIARRYHISRRQPEKVLGSSHAAGEFMLPYFFGEPDECVYICCLDSKRTVLGVQPLFRGDVNSVAFSMRRLVESALSYNAAGVILAHNHPSGIALPSSEDSETTRRAEAALSAVGIALVDHIVVADDDFVSFADNGFFNARIK